MAYSPSLKPKLVPRKGRMTNVTLVHKKRLQSWSRKPARLSPAPEIRVTDSAETRIKKSKKISFYDAASLKM